MPMKNPRAMVAAALVLLGSVGVGDAAEAVGPLADYVAKPDSSYAWRVEARYQRHRAEILQLRLHSQTWRGVLWKHQVYIIRPRRVTTGSQGVLIVAGGRWRDTYDTELATPLPDEVDVFLRIAKRLQTIVTVVAQVPYQPLFGRTEDQIIAYTFDEYLRSEDPEWPLLLPMVKTVVRAMDATQEAVRREWETSLDGFTVMGGSKRGWTTWLVGAADTRVTATVPVVIDALNMSLHFPYQSEVWGAPSEDIRPYTDLNLHVALSSEQGRTLREIVDPFSYRSVLTQPKLIVVATNDSYFPVDSLNLYWRELEGPKFILYLPNENHNVENFRRIVRNLDAFNRHAAGNTALPSLDWEYQQDSAGLTLTVSSQPRPTKVHVWTATANSRDFRNAVWHSDSLRRRDNAYSTELPTPASGYVAIFVEATFGRWRSAYSLSTNLCVLSGQRHTDDTPSARIQAGVCGASAAIEYE